MAYADARFGYHQPQSDSVSASALDNNKRINAFLDDDSVVLDPSVLDSDIMQSPSSANPFRKDSLANSNGVLSPADSQAAWDHPYGTGMSAEPTSAGVPLPYHEDGSAYLQQPNPIAVSYAHQHPPPASWAFEHGSEHCVSNGATDFMPPPPQFEVPRYSRHRTDSVHAGYSQHQPSMPAHFIATPQVQTPMSPHSHQDWMGMAEREMENRPSHKRMRPGSPARTMIDFQRRDGIRKKNGRIDIPQERSIANIDELIEKETDEDQLKELKQQKRLLRNREAALASRQRKKKHTEDLEVKEKSYTQQISSLRAQVDELTREREHRARDQQATHQRLQEALRAIDTMQDERRELIKMHNEDTSSLRRKVELLSEQLQAGPAPAMQAQLSSTLSDFNLEMEGLHMGVGDQYDWTECFQAPDEFWLDKSEPIKQTPALEKKLSPAANNQVSAKQTTEGKSDPPIASGLLFMLLLCGAFVASKPSNSQASDLPNMPADVRAAAPAVLSTLLSESNALSEQTHSQTMASLSQEPLPSGIPQPNNGGRNRMDRVHRRITAPTKQQELDQAFSLTTSQYASMTNADFQIYDQQSTAGQDGAAPPSRRNLAEALASMEAEHARNSKSEVYTRSLLWDQIPADVVRQFKQIVHDHNEIEVRQRQQHRPSHDFTYKSEP
ncbi:unnamed protein product [Zymoseptoria tritici ST99CH_1A5]|uniref:BZIP domain-containing protein n=1 Tax=Zymoseptoria tritici ST99CH_1A5 TaxID=1276529 RepID=A0A1Y6LBZ3_ZYMTR|nr:unnamed protein product [Zymoseptoria tritici ST99CH_1A5]